MLVPPLFQYGDIHTRLKIVFHYSDIEYTAYKVFPGLLTATNETSEDGIAVCVKAFYFHLVFLPFGKVEENP